MTIDASETPRLLGEGVLLGDVVEECRVRPWTLRTVTPCRLWGLPLQDLLPLMRMYPAIGLLAAEYVKFKVVYTYNGDRCGAAGVRTVGFTRKPSARCTVLREHSWLEDWGGVMSAAQMHGHCGAGKRPAGAAL